MRYAGRICDWNDDRGYGFVVPSGGGDRAFVHVKAFQSKSRRPADGDLVSYAVSRDGRGRTNAAEVRFAGQRIERHIEQRTISRRVPRMLLGVLALAAVASCFVSGAMPLAPALAYGVMSLVSWMLYSLDKAAAKAGASRVPEGTLHLADLLGGWPGALVAQQQFRHKTAKASFQWMFWCSVLGNLAAVAWLVHSGTARVLTSALLGVGD